MKISLDNRIIDGGVLLAVSGGIDSMVMLDIFTKHCSGSGKKFAVATVNHHIRDTALSDCQKVKDYCDKHNIECTLLDVDAVGYAQKNKISLETSARILRYQALKTLANGRVICLAHNACDQAETVLMHLIRGSGLNGLVGMSKYNEYYRPLIDVTRKEIEDYAKNNGVEYVFDQTNDDNSYTRNYIRNVVLPKIEKVNDKAVENIIECSKLLSLDESFLNECVDKELAKFPLILVDGGVSIPIELFDNSASIVYRVIKRAFNMIEVYFDITKKHVIALKELANNICSKKISLPFDLIARRDYNKIIISKICIENNITESVKFSLGQIKFGQDLINIVPCGKDSIVRFDVTLIPKDAVIRTRINGDKFVKFGGISTTLKEYFIDKKIPKNVRDKVALIAKDNEIYVICGIEISDKVKITVDTKDENIYTFSK